MCIYARAAYGERREERRSSSLLEWRRTGDDNIWIRLLFAHCNVCAFCVLCSLCPSHDRAERTPPQHHYCLCVGECYRHHHHRHHAVFDDEMQSTYRVFPKRGVWLAINSLMLLFCRDSCASFGRTLYYRFYAFQSTCFNPPSYSCMYIWR